MDSRTRILDRIRQSIGSEHTGGDIESAFQSLCEAPIDAPVQPDLPPEDTVSRFIAEAQRNGAIVTELEDLDQVQPWLQEQANALATPPTLSLSPWVTALERDWGPFQVTRSAPQPFDSWGLVRAHSAMAETGTVMSLSRECPSGLLFLVERLVVLIDRQDIVRFQEDAWDRLLDGQRLPRTVNLITGPSRTADIEQQIQIGAHGPRRADYLIVESLTR